MSAPRSGKHRATAWVIAVLMVPVLYVLTEPPILYAVAAHRATILGRPKTEKWMLIYCAPYGWLVGRKSLQRFLVAYDQYWRERFNYEWEEIPLGH